MILSVGQQITLTLLLLQFISSEKFRSIKMIGSFSAKLHMMLNMALWNWPNATSIIEAMCLVIN